MSYENEQRIIQAIMMVVILVGIGIIIFLKYKN